MNHWSWALAPAIDDYSKSEIETLLINRKHVVIRNQSKYELLKILKENYEVEDDNLIPFEQLTVKQ